MPKSQLSTRISLSYDAENKNRRMGTGYNGMNPYHKTCNIQKIGFQVFFPNFKRSMQHLCLLHDKQNHEAQTCRIKNDVANFLEARYETDVIFHRPFGPHGTLGRGRNCFSGETHLYGVTTEIPVLPDGMILGCPGHYPVSVRDLKLR